VCPQLPSRINRAFRNGAGRPIARAAILEVAGEERRRARQAVLRRGMRRFICSIIALAGLAATPAMACRIWTPSAALSVIHAALPQPLPPGAVAFDVQFELIDGGWSALFTGIRPRVRQVIRGNYSGDIVIVRDRAAIRVTCYDPITNGGSGIILGMPVGYENGVLVLQPIFASPYRNR
jgi:hypothetical protein